MTCVLGRSIIQNKNKLFSKSNEMGSSDEDEDFITIGTPLPEFKEGKTNN